MAEFCGMKGRYMKFVSWINDKAYFVKPKWYELLFKDLIYFFNKEFVIMFIPNKEELKDGGHI